MRKTTIEVGCESLFLAMVINTIAKEEVGKSNINSNTPECTFICHYKTESQRFSSLPSWEKQTKGLFFEEKGKDTQPGLHHWSRGGESEHL